MSIKISSKKIASDRFESRIAKARSRRFARMRAEALKALRAKRHEAEDDDAEISINADSAEVLFNDQDKNVQVIVGEDPQGEGIVVAVTTAENDDIEKEDVLAAVTVGQDGEHDTEDNPEDASLSVEEARKAIRARLRH